MNSTNIKMIRKRLSQRNRETFPALYHSNFRYFWIGQCISLIGTWMQNAGQSWLVLQITNNAFLLGVLNAVQFMPMLLFSLYAGVIIDRFPKRKLIIATQIGLMLCALSLTILLYTGHVKYVYILIIAVFLGSFQALDNPARQSFMIELVGKDDLMNAIALNSSIFNAARIFGPALAGLMIAWLGPGAAFLTNGLSFLAVIYGLTKITEDGMPDKKAARRGILSDVKELLRYIKKVHILYGVIVVVTIVNIFCLNFNTLIPIFAVYSLHLNAQGYGFLTASMGVGALIGAMSLATHSGRGPRIGVFITGVLVLSVFLILLGTQSNSLLSSLFLAVSGWGMVTINASANSVMQLNSPNELRGRIMSVYALVTSGITPFGALYAGYLAKKTGSDSAFLISGAIGIFAVLLALYMFRGGIGANGSRDNRRG